MEEYKDLKAFKDLNKNKRELKRRQVATYRNLDEYKVKANRKDQKLKSFEEKHGLGSSVSTSVVNLGGNRNQVTTHPIFEVQQEGQENAQRSIRKAVEKRYDKQVYNSAKRRQKTKVLEQEMLKYGETSQTKSITTRKSKPESLPKYRIKAIAYRNAKNEPGTELTPGYFTTRQPFLDPDRGGDRMVQELNRRRVAGTKRGRPPPNEPWAAPPYVPPLNISIPGPATKRVNKKARIAREDIASGFSKQPPPPKTTRE
jgi:hypothetical protein